MIIHLVGKSGYTIYNIYGKITKLNGGNTVVAEPCMALIIQYIEIGFARLSEKRRSENT